MSIETLDQRAETLWQQTELEPTIPQLFHRFSEILSIPSSSGNEHFIRHYIRLMAERRGLTLEEDDAGNCLLQIPPLPNHQNAAGLVFQCHMDRVCIGEPDPNINPIIPVISADGKWIESENQSTTLGADNGCGVAVLLSLLDDLDKIPHGPIAFLFTTREEQSMSQGAGKVGFDLTRYKYLINLDHESQKEPTEATNHTACAGSSIVSLKINEEDRILKGDKKILKIKVSGLLGGHSGLNIGEGRVNAIKLLTNSLGIYDTYHINLVEIGGGERGSAIPTNAWATIAIDPLDEEKIKRFIMKLSDETRKVYKEEKDLKMQVDDDQPQEGLMLNQELTDKVMKLLRKLPTGVKENDTEGVITSTNLAVVETQEKELNIRMMTRSAKNELGDAYLAEIEELAKEWGAEVKTTKGYGRYKAEKDSDVMQLVERAHEKALGRKVRVVRVHAGTEPSVLLPLPKLAHLQMAILGLLLQNAHSEKERVNIPAFIDFYRWAKQIIIEAAGESR